MVKLLDNRPASKVALVETDKKEQMVLKLGISRAAKIALNREALALSRLDHPNIIKPVGLDKLRLAQSYVGSKQGLLALPFMRNGDLFDLTKTAQGLPENLARKFAKQVLLAMKYLHDNSVSHRDIKLENVVVNDELNAELIDFGFAESRDDLTALP